MLKGIREAIGRGKKVAVFWDNASIHKAAVVREAAEKEDIDIKLCFNMPYRPDTNGIEYVWRTIKQQYRSAVEGYKARNQFWNNQALIENLIDQYPDQKAKDNAHYGWRNLANAKPIQRLPTEPEPARDWNEQLRRGPEYYYNDPSDEEEEEAEENENQIQS